MEKIIEKDFSAYIKKPPKEADSQKAPHIKRKDDGTIKFYEGLSLFARMLHSILLFLVAMFLFLPKYSHEEINIILILSFILFIFYCIPKFLLLFLTNNTFGLSNDFYDELHIKNIFPFMKISPSCIKIKNKDYLWQDISKIYAYTIKTSHSRHPKYEYFGIVPNSYLNRLENSAYKINNFSFYTYNLSIVFSKDGSIKELKNIRIYENEWQTLLSSLKEYKEIVEDILPPTT